MMRCFAKRSYTGLILLAALMIWGCERATLSPDMTRTGYDYSPMHVGDYRIYNAYRIKYNFAAENDTFQYEFKEQVAEAFLNQQGDSTFVIHKLHRQPGDSFWKLDSLSHWRFNKQQAIEHANNQETVKLVFPVGEGTIWNSNLYNTLQADSFRMVQVHKPLSIADKEFEQTLTVIHRNIQDTIVRQDIRREVYATGIGPVYRLVKTLNYCATQDCIGKGIINSGLYQEMILTDYGKD